MIPLVRIRARRSFALCETRALIVFPSLSISLFGSIREKDRPFRGNISGVRTSIGWTNSVPSASTNSLISAAWRTMNDAPFADIRRASERIVYRAWKFKASVRQMLIIHRRTPRTSFPNLREHSCSLITSMRSRGTSLRVCFVQFRGYVWIYISDKHILELTFQCVSTSSFFHRACFNHCYYVLHNNFIYVSMNIIHRKHALTIKYRQKSTETNR